MTKQRLITALCNAPMNIDREGVFVNFFKAGKYLFKAITLLAMDLFFRSVFKWGGTISEFS
jgi:hypothetical protein